MKSTLDPADLARSVIAVPPLCRRTDLTLNPDANQRLIHHLEAGGVRTLLYGGNANFYHIALSEYESLLEHLRTASGPDTVVIPSVGPSFGLMMDQAAVLARVKFPAVMILPTLFPASHEGVREAVLRFVEKAQTPVVLYLKEEKYLSPTIVEELVGQGIISWIKYAVVRPDPTRDPWLEDILNRVPPDRVISGIGEQPALIHLRQFGVGGFTSGCVCVAPRLSMDCLEAARKQDWEMAERIRRIFTPLEDLRNQWGPIPVLHHAVAEAGIAETGPHLPLLSSLSDSQIETIREAAVNLRGACL